MKTYLFEYAYEGAWYTMEVRADSRAEAEARVQRMITSRYVGERIVSIPVPSFDLLGWLRRWFG